MAEPTRDDPQVAQWLDSHARPSNRTPNWGDVTQRALAPRAVPRGLSASIAVVAAAAIAGVVLMFGGAPSTESTRPPTASKMAAGSVADGRYVVMFSSLSRSGSGWFAEILVLWPEQVWIDAIRLGSVTPPSDTRPDTSPAVSGGGSFVGEVQTPSGATGQAALAELRIERLDAPADLSTLPVDPSVRVTRCVGGEVCQSQTHPTLAELAATLDGTSRRMWVTISAGVITRIDDVAFGMRELEQKYGATP